MKRSRLPSCSLVCTIITLCSQRRGCQCVFESRCRVLHLRRKMVHQGHSYLAPKHFCKYHFICRWCEILAYHLVASSPRKTIIRVYIPWQSHVHVLAGALIDACMCFLLRMQPTNRRPSRIQPHPFMQNINPPSEKCRHRFCCGAVQVIHETHTIPAGCDQQEK